MSDENQAGKIPNADQISENAQIASTEEALEVDLPQDPEATEVDLAQAAAQDPEATEVAEAPEATADAQAPEATEGAENPPEEKMTFMERLTELCDETDRELGAKEISEEDFQEVLDLAVGLASDGGLSAEDTEKIMDLVSSKEGILTHKHADKLLDAVRKEARGSFEEKVPTALRIIGGLSFFSGVVGVAKTVYSFTSNDGALLKTLSNFGTVESVLAVIALVVTAIAVVLNIILGARLLRGKRGRAAEMAYTLVGITVALIVLETLLTGISVGLFILLLMLVVQIVLSCYLHPSLARERELEHALFNEETKRRAESGTLGRQLDKKDGYIKLDFFNIFWIFVICSVLGLIVEIIWHMVVVEPGVYQDRAGLLFGPFSPIYGVGAVLMTMATNRIKYSNIIIVFIICTIIGGAFEYFVSWWMENAFGIIAWDYSGKFLGDLFQGRTCLMFASMFGALGTIWIKLLLPISLRIINKVPWKWRYGVTVVCATLMLFNCVMTVQALDCWFMRKSGKPVVTEVQKFYAENFGDDYMATRFESMNIDPNRAARE